MNVKDKAKLYAINAHKLQVRKSEIDKPMIVHPLSVGMLLEEYGYDDEVVAAGYLHDVVEDTRYTILDIQKEFGSDIANLVKGATEEDKSLSWEERKMHAIIKARNLSLRNKVIICADKINNLEDLLILFQKSGKRIYSVFKRGEEKQKWYYKNMYDSLVYGEDETIPIFRRYKNVIDILFNNKENTYLKETIFKDDVEYYEGLKMLHAKKQELQRLKALCFLEKPFVIEFCGTPRTGKTTVINNLYDFFKKGDFNISVISEFTTSKYYKDEFRKRFVNASLVELNMAILKEVKNELVKALHSNSEIILIDRSINDRIVWNNRLYLKKEMSEYLWRETNEEYRKVSNLLIDFLVVTYTDSLTSLKRDYLKSLALEERSFLNINNLDEYNNSLVNLKDFFHSSVTESMFIDTTNMSMNEISVGIASGVMDLMRKKYLKSIEKKYNIKD